MVVAKIYGVEWACVAWDRCKNPEVFPPFLGLEGVLSMETREPRMIEGVDMIGEIVYDVTKSIVEYKIVLASAMKCIPLGPIS